MISASKKELEMHLHRRFFQLENGTGVVSSRIPFWSIPWRK
jgi:hypothetical protein